MPRTSRPPARFTLGKDSTLCLMNPAMESVNTSNGLRGVAGIPASNGEQRRKGVVMLASGSHGRLQLDIRGFDPTLRRALVFCVVDTLVRLGSTDELILVCDHEPAAFGYQIDLRKETRGLFAFEYSNRSDGAWVASIRPKSVSEGRGF
jgi:uncharacterized protein (DUF2249 family)